MDDHRQRRGRRGEDAATAHLERLGYEVLCRNWRSRSGEIDLVVLDEDTVVLVEVKLRFRPFDPLEAVDARKQRQLARVALDCLLTNGWLGRPARFDVVAVDGRTLACTHVMNAFDCAFDY